MKSRALSQALFLMAPLIQRCALLFDPTDPRYSDFRDQIECSWSRCRCAGGSRTAQQLLDILLFKCREFALISLFLSCCSTGEYLPCLWCGRGHARRALSPILAQGASRHAVTLFHNRDLQLKDTPTAEQVAHRFPAHALTHHGCTGCGAEAAVRGACP